MKNIFNNIHFSGLDSAMFPDENINNKKLQPIIMGKNNLSLTLIEHLKDYTQLFLN